MQLITGGILSCCLLSLSLSAVVFPSKQTRGRREEEVEPILPCPGGQLFCEVTPDYPANINITDTVVASRLIKNAIFDSKPKLTEQTQLRSSFLKEARACDNRKGTVYPKKAKNIEGQFVFIVNDDQYRQSVEIEQCLGEGEVCLTDSDAPLPTTVCRQKFATYRMYVVNEEGRQVYDSFSLPSACICHHKSDLAIGFKLGPSYPQLTCPVQEELAINREPSSSSTSKQKSRVKPQRNNPDKIQFGNRNKREVQFRDSAESERPKFAPTANECNQEGKNYCANNDSLTYPAQAVLEALATNNEINPELVSQLFDSNCKDLSTRFFDIDEEQLCSGIPKIIFPRQAKNLKDEWRYIVNIDNYTQSVEIEECFNPDFPEEDFEISNGTNSSVLFESEEGSSPASSYGSCMYSGSPGNNPDLTVCRQLYTAHKLLALSSEGQLVVDSFELPSACACYYREDFVLTFRRDMDTNTTGSEPDMETITTGSEQGMEANTTGSEQEDTEDDGRVNNDTISFG